jgi:ubiquinone/menaquinone biosynthesis C-methylase UbiE
MARTAIETARRTHPRLGLVAAGVLLFAAAAAHADNWTGFGFNAKGPEMPRIREALQLRTGMSVADVGAGKGELTIALAREVGETGRVYSTDVDPKRVAALRALADKEQLKNVVVVQATPQQTGLPDACCDAIVLRRVYHHMTHPVETTNGLKNALRPGGLLAVIDLSPPVGVASDALVEKVKASGLELKQVAKDWPGPRMLGPYCALFRKPEP